MSTHVHLTNLMEERLFPESINFLPLRNIIPWVSFFSKLPEKSESSLDNLVRWSTATLNNICMHCSPVVPGVVLYRHAMHAEVVMLAKGELYIFS